MTFAERGAMLKAMSKALHEAREELIAASMANAGTPRGDSKFDIDGATGTLAYYASLGKRLGDRRVLVEGPGEQLTRSARFWGHHIKLPRRGVAVHINAFNFPAWGLGEKAAVALLAGVPVVTKPATATALLAFRCMEVLVESGVLPAGALQFVAGSAGDMLDHMTGQDVLAFTGSGETGAMLRGFERVVGKSVRINVEADSLNSAILAPDVEAGSDAYLMFIRDTAREMTQKTGQKCTAVRRIFVPSGMVDRVTEDLGEQLSLVKIGMPSAEGARMGSLASEQQYQDVIQGLAELQESGAAVAWGSATDINVLGRKADEGYFVGPVLLRHDDPANASLVHSKEVFGPIATLLPYSDMAEVAGWVALGEGTLLTSLYTDDRKGLGEMIAELAPHTGRLLIGSRKIADQAISPGMVLPSCVHGGPGRAGGGEELGGLRGLDFYMQRTSVQGDRALLDRTLQPETA
jgi:oxepin-CoA hydrolase/3-oxo-5,6-dehydrosuberyl-CoA semialdehyde dehydrogenase